MRYYVKLDEGVLASPGDGVIVAGTRLDRAFFDEPNWQLEVAHIAVQAGLNVDDTIHACSSAFNVVLCSEDLIAVNCSGEPNGINGIDFNGTGEIDYSDFLTWTFVVEALGGRKPRTPLQRRRSAYSSKRPKLLIEMLKAGQLYRCSVDGCADSDITIDHILPIAMGGGDEVENLQFLCRSHNCAKGART